MSWPSWWAIGGAVLNSVLCLGVGAWVGARLERAADARRTAAAFSKLPPEARRNLRRMGKRHLGGAS